MIYRCVRISDEQIVLGTVPARRSSFKQKSIEKQVESSPKKQHSQYTIREPAKTPSYRETMINIHRNIRDLEIYQKEQAERERKVNKELKRLNTMSPKHRAQTAINKKRSPKNLNEDLTDSWGQAFSMISRNDLKSTHYTSSQNP